MRFRSDRWKWVAVTLLTFSCNTGTSDPATDPAAPPESPSLPTVDVDPVATELPDIVARVNSRAITREELERAVRSTEIQAGQALPTQFRDQVYRSVLDRLISFHLLVQESEALNISVKESIVEAQLEMIRSNFQSEEAFGAQLDSWNTTLEILRDETRRDLLVQEVLENEALANIDVDIETVREFYNQHTEQFTEGGGVRARHILIGLSPDAQEPDKAEARQRAKAVRSEIAEGADFTELARTHSEDPGSAETGGDLGIVVKGQTVPQFEEALFALEPGEVSGIVETTFGFHIIQMIERQESRVVEFAEASVQIREFLLQQEQQAQTSIFIEELKTKSEITILI